MYVVVMTYIWIGRSWIYLYILRYCSAACIYFSFRWGLFVHSLEIVQWDSIRRDHPGYPGRVFGSGSVISNQALGACFIPQIALFSLHTK